MTKRKFAALEGVLDERTLRLMAAAEALSLCHRGVTLVSRASGLSRGAVTRGIAELKLDPKSPRGGPVRRKGAGRKRTADRDPTLMGDLAALMEPAAGGDPEPPLLDTQKGPPVSGRTQGYRA